MADPTTTRLYWSERGAIACLDHAPYRGSDTWVWERWRAMRLEEIASYTKETGSRPRCEGCGMAAGEKAEETEMTKPKKSTQPKTTKRPSSKTKAKAEAPAAGQAEAAAPAAAGEDLMVFAFRLPKSLSAKFHEKAGRGNGSRVARQLIEDYVGQPAGEAS